MTLSLGEQTIETYRRLAKASGNPSNLRYLARFETSNPELFKVLHGARGDHARRSFRTASACFATFARRAIRWVRAS
ncbi:MAG: hypothetical protein ACLUNV_05900 [Sutterella wadsworthensis]